MIVLVCIAFIIACICLPVVLKVKYNKYNEFENTTFNIIERKNINNALYLTFDIRYLYDESIILVKNVKLVIISISKNFNLLSLQLNFIFIFSNFILFLLYWCICSFTHYD